jgi:hypothetical protein
MSDRFSAVTLSPSQAGEGAEQYQGAESAVIVAVGRPVLGHLPQRSLGIGSRPIDLGSCPPYTLSGKPEPISPGRKLAGVADRAAPHTVGQVEHLGHGEHRPFGGVRNSVCALRDHKFLLVLYFNCALWRRADRLPAKTPLNGDHGENSMRIPGLSHA